MYPAWYSNTNIRSILNHIQLQRKQESFSFITFFVSEKVKQHGNNTTTQQQEKKIYTWLQRLGIQTEKRKEKKRKEKKRKEKKRKACPLKMAAALWTIDRHLARPAVSFYARPVACNSQRVIPQTDRLPSLFLLLPPEPPTHQPLRWLT